LNDYKINEYNKYKDLKKIKVEYVKIKKEMNENKKNKRKYIGLNKKLKKYHSDIRNMEKNLDIVKKTLISKEDNINMNYNYNLIDGLYLLEGHIIKKEETKKIKKKTKKEIKNEEKMIKENVFEQMEKEMGDLLTYLL